MKVSALAHAAVFGLALAGCTNSQPASQATSQTPQAPRSFDTGNMAYPTPQPQGQVGSTEVNNQRRRRPRDVGSMAYPRPSPQGNIGTTRVQ